MAVPQTEFMTPEANVETRLNKILQSKSPLLQTARQQGLTSAARRGLQNSSIAAGASSRAMIDTALPIAQQDAGTTAQFNLATQNKEYQKQLAKQKYGFDVGLLGAEYKQRGALSAQEAAQQLRAQREAQRFQGGQSEADRALQRESQIRDIESQFGLSRQEAEQRLAQQEQQFGFQTQLSAQEAGQQLEQTAAQGEQARQTQYQQYDLRRQELMSQAEIDREIREDQQAFQSAQMILQGDIQGALKQVDADLLQKRDNYIRQFEVADRDFAANRAAMTRYTDFVEATASNLRQTIVEISTSPDLTDDAKQYLIQQYIGDANAAVDSQADLIRAFGLSPQVTEFGQFDYAGPSGLSPQEQQQMEWTSIVGPSGQPLAFNPATGEIRDPTGQLGAEEQIKQPIPMQNSQGQTVYLNPYTYEPLDFGGVTPGGTTGGTTGGETGGTTGGENGGVTGEPPEERDRRLNQVDTTATSQQSDPVTTAQRQMYSGQQWQGLQELAATAGFQAGSSLSLRLNTMVEEAINSGTTATAEVTGEKDGDTYRISVSPNGSLSYTKIREGATPQERQQRMEQQLTSSAVNSAIQQKAETAGLDANWLQSQVRSLASSMLSYVGPQRESFTRNETISYGGKNVSVSITLNADGSIEVK